jgi:hypothetical protein
MLNVSADALLLQARRMSMFRKDMGHTDIHGRSTCAAFMPPKLKMGAVAESCLRIKVSTGSMRCADTDPHLAICFCCRSTRQAYRVPPTKNCEYWSPK